MPEHWITTLPEGWSLKQIRHIFQIYNGATPKSGESEYWNGDINWITPEDLGNNDGKEIVESRRKITVEGYTNSGVSLAPAGSIAISIRAPIGHLAKTMIPSCVNQGCRLLEPKEGNSDYWYYAATAAKPILVSRGQGTTFMELPRQNLASVKLPVPPICTQEAIARFLDFKTAQIDTLISKQKALLNKLAEKRAALISNAVTKGLDPSVKMKDSGVEWLGEIPHTWNVTRLRFLVKMSGGMTPSTNKPEYWGGDIPWVSPKDMKRDAINDSIDTLTEQALLDTNISLYEPNNVLIVVRGMILAHTFPVAINTVPVTVNQDMKVLSTSLDCEYLSLLLKGIQGLILSVVEESAHGTKVLRTDVFKNIYLPVPPKDEQKNIVKEIKKITHLIDKQINSISLLIARLQEYRSTLITSAVTGKIDVRDFPIPEQCESQQTECA
ncbi:restriction endonuclease subunit S [Pectobacterium brasiliense]|uniref:restriction endonuclease subunit S n=1 Tax=Pectobacterium brasiliense TaxID=180957 RepID=UPI0032F0422B